MSITLTIIAGPQQGRSVIFTDHDTFIVGRGANVHASFPDDPWFSRVHFLIEVNPPLCRLADLKSRNGTLVNNQRVLTRDLCHGDTIQAGTTILQVEMSADSREQLENLFSPSTTPVSTLPHSSPALSVRPPVIEPSVPDLSGLPASSQSTPRPEPLPTVPGYTILDRIGRGAMGTVYRAHREEDGSLAAIKIIRPRSKPSASDVARFLREARTLKRLHHPGIVGYRDLNESLDLLYLAMEYVPGPNLADLAGRSPGRALLVGTAVRLLCQALDALSYAHGVGFVHRDVKPSNLLVTQEGGRETVKLADFGLAKAYHASPLSGLTLTGVAGGTAPFMPPEQALDFRSARPAADQFAAAATLYTLLTGRSVYDGPTSLDMMVQALQDDYAIRPLRQHRPDLPARLEQVLQRALAHRPEARFPDVLAFRRELLPFADA